MKKNQILILIACLFVVSIFSCETSSSKPFIDQCTIFEDVDYFSQFKIGKYNYYSYAFYSYITNTKHNFPKLQTSMYYAQKLGNLHSHAIDEKIDIGTEYQIVTSCQKSTDCSHMILHKLGSFLSSNNINITLRILGPELMRIRDYAGVEIIMTNYESFRNTLDLDDYPTKWLTQNYLLNNYMFFTKGYYIPIDYLQNLNDFELALKLISFHKKNPSKIIMFTEKNSNILSQFFVADEDVKRYFFEKFSFLHFKDYQITKKHYTFISENEQEFYFAGYQSLYYELLYHYNENCMIIQTEKVPKGFAQTLPKQTLETSEKLYNRAYHKYDNKFMEFLYWAHSDYSKIWNTPHIIEYNHVKKNPTKNAVIAFAFTLSRQIENAKAFLITAKNHFINDDLIIFCDDESQEIIRSFSATIGYNNIKYVKARESIHGNNFDKYNNMMRGVNYFYYFQNEAINYKHIFLVDFIDITFQGTVFDNLPQTYSYIQLNYLDQFEVFKVSMKADSWLNMFFISEKMMEFFGLFTTKDLEGEYMICGGTIIGDQTSLLMLYTFINNLGEQFNFDSKSDQLFLVYTYFHFGHLFNFIPLDNGDKIFMFKLYPNELCNNCHMVSLVGDKYWVDGYARPPAVLHKLNRFFQRDRIRLMDEKQLNDLKEYLVLNGIDHVKIKF